MATLLLKKSYQLSNLKEVTFKDLWGSRGVFTTMRMVGKPPKLILLKPHLENLIKSTKKYGIRKKNLKNIIKYLINKNTIYKGCLLYTSPSPRDRTRSRMPSSA